MYGRESWEVLYDTTSVEVSPILRVFGNVIGVEREGELTAKASLYCTSLYGSSTSSLYCLNTVGKDTMRVKPLVFLNYRMNDYQQHR